MAPVWFNTAGASGPIRTGDLKRQREGRARDRGSERGEGVGGLDRSFNAYASRLKNDYLAVWL